MLGQDGREVEREPHGDGFNHVVRRIDQDQVEAAPFGGQKPEHVRAGDLGALEAELVEIAA